MSDPYRNVDPATLQDDVGRLKEDFEETRAFVAQFRFEVDKIGQIIRVFRLVFLCVFLPLVLGVFPVSLGILVGRTDELQREVQVLHTARDRQEAVTKSLVWELRHMWRADSEQDDCLCDFGEAEWKCIAWRSW